MISRMLSVLVLAAAVPVSGQVPAGRWDGTLVIGALKVPLRMMFSGDGASLTGAFANGSAHAASSSGQLQGDAVELVFGDLGTRLEARLVDGVLKGSYGGGKLGTHAFTASAYCSCGYDGEAGPAIMGVWEAPAAGWRLTVQRDGEDTLVTVARKQGTIGPLTGRFDGAVFTLNYFDGSRAAVLELAPRKDGDLDLVWQEPGAEAVRHKATRLKE